LCRRPSRKEWNPWLSPGRTWRREEEEERRRRREEGGGRRKVGL